MDSVINYNLIHHPIPSTFFVMWLEICVSRGLEPVHRNQVKKGFTSADYSKALSDRYY